MVLAAGRLFAERGYHGTSMRDLGGELGLLGSSLYSHIDGKQELLVEVVERGAAMFEQAAGVALSVQGSAIDRLRALIKGHIRVVLDHSDEVRTFLNEARALDVRHRLQVVEARDRYEQAFRTVIKEGAADGSFNSDLDPKVSGIFVLSILNAVQRWYRSDGALDRDQLTEEVHSFAVSGLS